VGLPTSSTMMYGHVDTPALWVRHLMLLARMAGSLHGSAKTVAELHGGDLAASTVRPR
jgi:FO synthase